MGWRLAQSLQIARAELDALYPHRPRTGQEGTIGNTAHVAEGWTASDHNPWVTLGGTGIVRAWDIDCTATVQQIISGDSFDPNKLAEYLAALQRARFAAFGTRGYVIWNRHITTSGSPGGVWQNYYGSDPHDRHIHVSVGVNPAEFDSTATWNLGAAFGKSTLTGTATPITDPSEEDDMAQVPQEQWDALFALVTGNTGFGPTGELRGALAALDGPHGFGDTGELRGALERMDKTLSSLPTVVAALQTNGGSLPVPELAQALATDLGPALARQFLAAFTALAQQTVTT